MSSAQTTAHRLPTRWEAQWISPAADDEGDVDRPAYLLSRRFDLDGAPGAATLYATALGVYEVFVNGIRVGDEELAPGSTSYQETLYAQSYVVTDLVREGENLLEVVLSDGWYRGRNGSTQIQNCWGDRTAALVQLETVGEGGPRTIVSDGSWTSRVSAITRADLITGQDVDFSADPAPEAPVRVGVVRAPEPSSSPAPPVRRIAELPVREITEIRPGVSIVDFGQNIAGWARLTDLGDRGRETTLEFGEHVDPDGDLVTAHLDTNHPSGERVVFHQTDRVVSGGNGETFEPRHTIHGFRYARVTHEGRSLDASALTAIVVHTDLERTGWFVSDDDRLNRLHETAVWTFRGNAVDVPTDCPTRERLGWTGDYQIFAPFASLLFDIDGFSRKWLHSVRDDQYDSGSLPMYAPDSYQMKIHPENPDAAGGGSAGWGDAAVAVPWALYRQYGDTAVLAENWESMRAWVEFALTTARTTRHHSRADRPEQPHEEFIWDGSFHFGEWAEPRRASADTADVAAAFRALMLADKGEVGTAYLHRSTAQLADIADVLGRADEASHYRAIAERVRDAWRTEYLRDDGRTAGDTQAAYVRAIDFGLIPADLVPAAAARLVDLVSAADGHLSTGFLSTGSLLSVLADNGYPEVAYRLLTQTGVPSWYGMLERGATTFWENWEAVGADGVVTDGSLDHYSKGAAFRFLYTHVVGLRQDEGSVGWRRFTVAPVLGGDLAEASARLQTPSGRIEAAWRLEDGDLVLTVDVPEGAAATAVLSGADPVPLGPGVTVLRGAV